MSTNRNRARLKWEGWRASQCDKSKYAEPVIPWTNAAWRPAELVSIRTDVDGEGNAVGNAPTPSSFSTVRTFINEAAGIECGRQSL